VGTLATILQMLKLPDGTIKVLVEGVKRAEIEEFVEVDNYTEVKVKELSLIEFFSQCLKHQFHLEWPIKFYPIEFVRRYYLKVLVSRQFLVLN
jgi:ATP-dependent Lon protease